MEDLDKYLTFPLDVARIVAPFAGPALGISVAASVLSKLGVRVGPGRAFVLGFKSYFQRSTNPNSVRTSLVSEIRDKMSQAYTDHFVVVYGPKGVGKTVAVATAFRGQMGVVHANISAGDSACEIIQKALGAVANVPAKFTPVDHSGPRVIFWYQLMFRHFPLVILNIKEKSPNKPHAEIAEAARTLSSDYQLRVLVDGSNNTLPDELFVTMRGHFVDVDEMDQETVESIPEFEIFITSLREADLADVVYHIIGGVPAHYKWLRDVTAGRSGEKLSEAVNFFLERSQSMAIKLRLLALHSHPAMSQLYDLFKTAKAVSETRADVNQVTRPSPDKTLRALYIGSKPFLIPSTRAMAYILRNDCAEAHSVAQIREVLKCQTDNSNIDKQQLTLP
jgi:hypothetical protein